MTDQTGARLAWEAAFLDALRAGKGAVMAAAAAGVDRSTPYYRRGRNARFAGEWQEALEQAGAKPGKAGQRSPHWRKIFLETLAETSNIRAAAAQANVPPQTAYRQRRNDPGIRERFRVMLLDGASLGQYLRGIDSLVRKAAR